MNTNKTPYKNLLITLVLLLSGGLQPVASVYAKSAKNMAKDYCKSWEKKNPDQECGIVRGLICTGKNWKKLKTFKALWTSCKLVRGQAEHAKAQNRCKDYLRYWGANTCQVHSPRCKAGWTKLTKYGKSVACRPLEFTSSMLYNAYKAFMKKWEGLAQRRMSHYQNAFIKKHYSFNPAKVKWGQISNPHAGCTTDCYSIYCKSSKSIYNHIQQHTFSKLMFHELAHVDQCKNKGSRRAYAKMWFGHLPKGFFSALKPGVKDKFKNKIHDRMPMEAKAEAKAIKVFNAYKAGHYHVKWKCRLYHNNKVIWKTANTYLRWQCQDKSHKTYKNALSSLNQHKKSNNGVYKYVFGKKQSTHYLIWKKNISTP